MLRMRIYKVLKSSVLAACFFSMSGCVLLPGMSMSNPGAYNNGPTADPATPIIIPVTPQLIAQVSQDLHPYEYRIGSGDVLNIAVWSMGLSVPLMENSLSGAGDTSSNSGSSGNTQSVNSTGYPVDPRGDIFIPILGKVHVAGLTSDQTAQMLNHCLALYIKHPQSIVGVSSFGSQQVYVMGAISGASGSGQNQASMLTVPITSTTPATLASALSTAGGINTSSADTRLVYVIRPSSLTHPSVYWLNMESPASMLYAENFPLTNNDVVFVSTAGIARTNDVLAQILPFVQTLWFTKSLVAPNS